MKKLFAGLMVTLALVMGGVGVLQPAFVSAAAKDDVCAGVGIAGGAGQGCQTPTTGPTLDSTIKTVINLISLAVGIVSVIMIIIGGLKYIMSAGDSNNISGAKNTIMYAIIGLVVVALAQLIVKFVLSKTS